MTINIRKATLVALAFGALAGLASGQPVPRLNDHVPGSVLIYPIYISDFTNGYASVVSVSNTNGDRRFVLPGNPPGVRGDVLAHYFWIDGTGTWNVFDNQALLTPNDTRSILSYDALNGTGNQDFETGFLVIEAVDPETQESVDFDYLIGDIILVDIAGTRTWNIEATGIKALTDELVGNPVRSNRGHAFVDRVANGGDGDGNLDFDNVEYQRWPDVLFLSSFFRQDDGANGTNNDCDVILLTDLGRDFRVNLQFLFYDRDEDETSRTGDFVCWTRADLFALANITATASFDPAGWGRINSPDAINLITGAVVADPCLMGAMVQSIIGQAGLEFGHLMHHSGINPTAAQFNLD